MTVKKLLSMFLCAVMIISCSSSVFAAGSISEQSLPNEQYRVNKISELRERNADTYLLSDGTYECVVYSEDKYYLDADGEFKEINNTIVPTDYKSETTTYKYVNAANSTLVYFSDECPSVLIKSGDNQLAFSIVNSRAEKVQTGAKGNEYKFPEFDLRSDNCITYTRVCEETDIVYSVNNGYVKEYIVLNGPNAPTDFQFTFDTTDCYIKENDVGTLNVYNSNGELSFEFGALFAVDAAGKHTDNLKYKIVTKDKDATIISVSIDPNFLIDAGTVFPILIDPSVMVTGESNTYDTYVSSRYPAQNYYLNNYLRTGRDVDYYVRRTYIKFDLPTYINKNNYSNIYSAYINIKKYSGSSPSVTAYRTTGSWTSSTLTWNNKPGYTTTDASTSAALYSDNWYRLYVTSIVKGWYAEANINYGFVLKDTTESDNSQWTTFYSSDAASPNKPELHIFYSEGQYLNHGSAGKYIYVYPYSYNDLWQAAIDQSRSNWNTSSAPIYFYTSSSSNNRIYASQYDYTAYGKTYPLEVSGSTLTKFKIELNSRTIANDAASGNVSNFIQSVLVHELGHTIWLADNPITSSSSIMKYSRNRDTMTNPSSYDIANVDAKY